MAVSSGQTEAAGSKHPWPIQPLYTKSGTTSVLVLDAGAFIHKQSLPVNTSLLTTSGILKEVRDPASRLHVALLPQTVTERVPSAAAISRVRAFAAKTGDGGFLSANDVGILALAVMVAEEHGLSVRQVPVTSAADMVDAEKGTMFRWNPPRQATDESDSDEWITVSNFPKLQASQTAQISPAVSDTPQIALVTGDYSVQNVALQLGLAVRSYDGLAVQSVKQWGLLCVACWNLTRDTQKAFCPHCGTDAVRRVAVTTDVQGKVAMTGGRPKKPQLKGTIYSIPKPKGGRDPNRLILAEDELMIGGRDRKLKREQRAFAKDLEQRLAIGGDNDDFSIVRGGILGAFAHAPKVVAGYGRKNPNSGNFKKPQARK